LFSKRFGDLAGYFASSREQPAFVVRLLYSVKAYAILITAINIFATFQASAGSFVSVPGCRT
jgi:hypothetical protein